MSELNRSAALAEDARGCAFAGRSKFPMCRLVRRIDIDLGCALCFFWGWPPSEPCCREEQFAKHLRELS